MNELQLDFRDVMAGVPAPVAVITTLLGDVPHGTTVSAWASLSMTPPMVLISLDASSVLLERLRESLRFGVNVLAGEAGAHQADVAVRFASKSPDKFDGASWSPADGLPRLSGTAGWLACEVTAFVPGGDHVVVLGEVVAAQAAPLAPLSYSARRFGTHTPLP